jgi:hypothetical protein
MDYQYIFIIAAVILYAFRFFQKQKKEQEEAQRRRGQVPPKRPAAAPTVEDVPPSGNQPQPKTIDEILKEMHRRIETQNKPYAKPATPEKPVKKILTKKEPPPKPQPRVPEKKEPAPFLSEELSAYTIEGARTPANMAEDFIKQGELTDVYNVTEKKQKPLPKFNLRDAVIASVVLNRPEW